MRPCEDCRLCCKVFPLPVLDKLAGAWCRHIGAVGCAIHGPQTPEICRQYDCYWREHDDLPASWRPDRIGIVVSEAGNVTISHHVLPVVHSSRGSFRGKPGQRGPGVARLLRLARLRRDGHSRFGGAVEFDPARWPGIASEEIEAALRYELSQDAEELKRLGAVGDEYRPLSREEAEAVCREERALVRCGQLKSTRLHPRRSLP